MVEVFIPICVIIMRLPSMYSVHQTHNLCAANTFVH